MRILFMGPPDFAVESLKNLYEKGHEICCVFTQPDRPKNRGMKLVASPVKQLALAHDTPVYQPTKLRDGKALEEIKKYAPDIIVVVAYGRILPKDILEAAPLGCINVHASILPAYRGSAPIQWAVLNGEKVSGVTTMYMVEQMDAGDIIDVCEVVLEETDTYGSYYDKLKVAGAQLLCSTLELIQNGNVRRKAQDETQVSFAPPITKAISPIDWTHTADQIYNQVRGLNPTPGATAEFRGEKFKIFTVKKTGKDTQKEPGTVLTADKHGLEVACGGGSSVLITELQAPGGKRMSAADYLRGHNLFN